MNFYSACFVVATERSADEIVRRLRERVLPPFEIRAAGHEVVVQAASTALNEFPRELVVHFHPARDGLELHCRYRFRAVPRFVLGAMVAIFAAGVVLAVIVPSTAAMPSSLAGVGRRGVVWLALVQLMAGLLFYAFVRLTGRRQEKQLRLLLNAAVDVKDKGGVFD